MVSQDVTEFGQAALVLDGEFRQFEALVRELEHLGVDSDKGLKRGLVLVAEINSCRGRLESGMKGLGAALESVRQRNEAAEKVVAEKSADVQERQLKSEQLFLRLKMLGDLVNEMNDGVVKFRDQAAAAEAGNAPADLPERFAQFDSQLGRLVDEARKLVDDAHDANMKFLEQNADSLRQSLASARNKLGLLLERHVKAPTLH